MTSASPPIPKPISAAARSPSRANRRPRAGTCRARRSASSANDTRAREEAIEQPPGHEPPGQARAAHRGDRQRAASGRDAAIGQQRRQVRDGAVLRDRAAEEHDDENPEDARAPSPSRTDAPSARCATPPGVDAGRSRMKSSDRRQADREDHPAERHVRACASRRSRMSASAIGGSTMAPTAPPDSTSASAAPRRRSNQLETARE